MRDARVVVQQRRIHAGFRRLVVTQQCSPVEIVAKQPVAVPEKLLRGHRRSGSAGEQAHERQCDGDRSRRPADSPFSECSGNSQSSRVALCQIAKMPDIYCENHDVVQENPPG